MAFSWLTNLRKQMQHLFGTPTVMLMTADEMFTHVVAFLDLSTEDDIQRTMSRWDELVKFQLQQKNSDWETFITKQDDDQILKWARNIGKQAELIKRRKGSLTDAMAYQMMAIYLRSTTMNDPASRATEKALAKMITLDQARPHF